MAGAIRAPGELAAARRRITEARGVVILTGAGVSAESGVPTFRDRTGLWARFDPQELATPEAFRRDPEGVWEWYHLRRQAVLACRPNPGHLAIARFLLERRDAVLVTQNVDGLHQLAFETLGSLEPPPDRPVPPAPAGRILELHGNLLRSRCAECGRTEDDASSEPRPGGDRRERVPRCGRCGSLLRPDVVWFGEMLDAATLDEAFRRAAEAEVCLVAGTSALVHPAASVPLATLRGGGLVIEVNPRETPLTPSAGFSFRGPSGRLLPELLRGATAP